MRFLFVPLQLDFSYLHMTIPIIESVKAIEQQFSTGEEPVLVTCSDRNRYICKYMRSSATPFKLVCEFVGARMAFSWQLTTPDIAFVQIKQKHWNYTKVSHYLSAPAIGSKLIENVVDITPTTYREIVPSELLLQQLIRIALFDFWMANEDRNANNANLLYDILQDKLVSIDYGCIFNTATFDYPMSQLTSTDTILWSDLFQHLAHRIKKKAIEAIIKDLDNNYPTILDQSKKQVTSILEELPKGWNIKEELVENKLIQLFEKQWVSTVWDNFYECLIENLNNE